MMHSLRITSRGSRLALSPFCSSGTSTRRWALQASALHSSATRHALSKFMMPAMSPTMTEGGIASWKKKAGDTFAAGDVLLEIETDKATMDVEAQEDGVMAKIVVEDGAKNVAVNSIIAIIGEEGDDIAGADKLAAEAENSSPPKSEEPDESKESETKSETEPKEAPSTKSDTPSESKEKEAEHASDSAKGDRVFASPIARRLAQEKGIPLGQVKGSGPNGRIVKADVDGYKAPSSPSASTSASSPSKQASSSSAAAPPPPPPSSSDSSSQYTDTPVTSMRKVIASRLTESKQQVPHYYVSIDVEMDKVLRLRQLFNEASEKKAGGDAGKAKDAKLSVGDFITKAASVALGQVPEVNAAWYGDVIRQFHTADISIAVSTPTGLLTPIVKNVNGIGLASISATTKSLAAKARQGKLKPEEYQGGSFTISNMGMFGITHFTAIINAPQSCILAIGGTEARMVIDESEEKGWRKAMVMQATISADHRTVDGATAARWMKAFKDALENPLSFML
ncbi:hypothetical protein CBS101457_000436 [Exobasidium rhododendri]|nr:hypothetical protein CBS101457_000436 [Exobasidium rhododendri]